MFLASDDVTLGQGRGPILLERVAQLGDLVAQDVVAVDGGVLVVEDGTDIGGTGRQLPHAAHVEEQLGVAGQVGLAGVGGDGSARELVTGVGQPALGFGHVGLRRQLLGGQVVEASLGGAEGGLDGRDLGVERTHLGIQVAQMSVRGIELVQ